VINELDTQALAFANYMKKISGDADGQIIALTMGPPMAARGLAIQSEQMRRQSGAADRQSSWRSKYRCNGEPFSIYRSKNSAV